jgi:hydrogenase maturation protease
MAGRLAGAGERIVVIGYGNRLRTDDGAGPHVASAVASWELPGLVSLAVHQLTPELTDLLASAKLAIFVDARLTSVEESVLILPLELSVDSGIYGHICDPRSLLALTQAIYRRTPQSWLITVPAADFSLGEGLSKTANQGAERALDRIAALVGGGLLETSPRSTRESAILPTV